MLLPLSGMADMHAVLPLLEFRLRMGNLLHSQRGGQDTDEGPELGLAKSRISNMVGDGVKAWVLRTMRRTYLCPKGKT